MDLSGHVDVCHCLNVAAEQFGGSDRVTPGRIQALRGARCRSVGRTLSGRGHSRLHASTAGTQPRPTTRARLHSGCARREPPSPFPVQRGVRSLARNDLRQAHPFPRTEGVREGRAGAHFASTHAPCFYEPTSCDCPASRRFNASASGLRCGPVRFTPPLVRAATSPRLCTTRRRFFAGGVPIGAANTSQTRTPPACREVAFARSTGLGTDRGASFVLVCSAGIDLSTRAVGCWHRDCPWWLTGSRCLVFLIRSICFRGFVRTRSGPALQPLLELLAEPCGSDSRG